MISTDNLQIVINGVAISSTQIAKANAAFIVKACNNYEEMLVALKKIAAQNLGDEMDEEDKEVADWFDAYEELIMIARAAISNAEKDQ